MITKESATKTKTKDEIEDCQEEVDATAEFGSSTFAKSITDMIPNTAAPPTEGSAESGQPIDTLSKENVQEIPAIKGQLRQGSPMHMSAL